MKKGILWLVSKRWKCEIDATSTFNLESSCTIASATPTIGAIWANHSFVCKWVYVCSITSTSPTLFSSMTNMARFFSLFSICIRRITTTIICIIRIYNSRFATIHVLNSLPFQSSPFTFCIV